MKLYIRASVSPENVFNKNDTKVSFYNDFLTSDGLQYMQKNKNRTGEIVYMSPDEYFRECAQKIFNGMSQQQLEDSRSANTSAIIEYTSAMKRGDVFPLPYINYADKSQEGLHRMMAAGDAFGWNTKFPVLIVTAFDGEYEAQVDNFNKMRDYERFDFKKVVEQAKDEISDWDNMAPPDILSQFEEAIRQAALNPTDSDIDSNNIDVEVEAVEKNGSILLKVWLTEFNGYEEDKWTGSHTDVWLDDMFDLSESPFDANDYNMNK